MGLSCQTAHQILHHQGFISELAGEGLKWKATPFDWVLAPLSSVTRMVETGCFRPDVSELVGDDKPYWPAMGVHFWHKHISDFPRWCDRVADNWRLIYGARRRVFIVSNTQNNVGRALMDFGRAPFDMSLDGLPRLRSALESSVGACELHAVSRETFRPDDTNWKGDDAQWRQFLLTIFSS